MSNEQLAISSEELIDALRKCSALDGDEDCEGCALTAEIDCYNRLLRAAANEIERLNKERRPTPKITGRHMGTFIEAAAIYMTKADLEGCEYETMEAIFDIYEWLRCAKKEEEA